MNNDKRIIRDRKKRRTRRKRRKKEDRGKIHTLVL
jgi:hypothetical protein